MKARQASLAPSELLRHVPSAAQIYAHRQVPLRPIDHPSGAVPRDGWGFVVDLRIDERGRVRCYRLSRQHGDVISLNLERQAWLTDLGKLRYLPFPEARTPRAAIVKEEVRERERMEALAAPPSIPLSRAAKGPPGPTCENVPGCAAPIRATPAL